MERPSVPAKVRQLFSINALSLLIATLSALFAYSSSHASWKSAEVARLSLETSARAYLGFAEARVVTLEPGKQAVVRIFLKNDGQTPAKRTRILHRLRIATSETSLPEVIDFGEKPATDRRVTSRPGAILALTAKTDRPVSAGVIDALEGGDVKMYVFGDVEYEDVFGYPHQTLFCVYYEPEHSTKFGYCEEHNAAD